MRKALKYLLLITLIFYYNPSAYSQGDKIDSLSRIFKLAKADTAKIDILNELAFGYLHVNPVVARDDVDIAFDAAQDIDYKRGIALSLNVMGGIEWAVGNYEKSLDYYLQSLTRYKHLHDELSVAMVNNNIGEVYKKLGDKKMSLNYLLDAKALLEKHGHPTLGYVNLGEIYLMLDNYDSAIHYFKQALQSNKTERNEQYQAYAYHGIAETEFSKDHFPPALENANLALQLRLGNRDHRGSSSTYLLLGEIYGATAKLDSALFFLNKALTEARRINARDIEMNVLEAKAQVFAQNNLYDSAYNTYLKHTKLKDDLFSEEKANQIAKLQTSFKTELLKKENESSAIKLKQRNTLIIAIVMMFILAIAVAGGLYKQRRIQQNVNKLLESKNEQIQAQSEEIQTQAEEVRGLNENLEKLNQDLEDKIKARTKRLRDQNKLLAQYTHSNAHELRAPVASIIGLINLLELSNLTGEEREVIKHLIKSSKELDAVIRDIGKKLEGNDDLFFDD